MKTRLAILIALATAGASFGTYAADGDVPAPVVNQPNATPRLYPSEQGAFKALEVVAQLIEARIVQKGCGENITWPVEVHTNSVGAGSAIVADTFGGSVPLAITLGLVKPNYGRQYDVTSPGGVLGGMTYAGIKAHGSFNIGSSIQELSTAFLGSSDVTAQPDPFNGTVIKDYTRLLAPQIIPDGFDDSGTAVSTVIDYGYQQISKQGFVKAKWWQQSRTWREDGVNSGTIWVKTRVAPAGQACSITIKLQGYGLAPADSLEGFNERGIVSFGPAIGTGPGPFKAN